MTCRITWGLSLILIATLARAAGPATTQIVDEQKQLEGWWKDLEKSDPWSSRAILDFYDRPTQAVAFFKAHLKPLKIDEKELDGALAALGSDDEKIWKPAFEKLEYLDPRLNRTVDDLVETVTDSPARNRLVSILTGTEADRWKDSEISYNKNGDWGYFSITSGNNGRYSYGVQTKVSQLSKSSWQRCGRALVLLQHIGTPDAIAVLKEMATGNPAATPTQIAKAALESLGTAAK